MGNKPIKIVGTIRPHNEGMQGTSFVRKFKRMKIPIFELVGIMPEAVVAPDGHGKAQCWIQVYIRMHRSVN